MSQFKLHAICTRVWRHPLFPNCSGVPTFNMTLVRSGPLDLSNPASNVPNTTTSTPGNTAGHFHGKKITSGTLLLRMDCFVFYWSHHVWGLRDTLVGCSCVVRPYHTECSSELQSDGGPNGLVHHWVEKMTVKDARIALHGLNRLSCVELHDGCFSSPCAAATALLVLLGVSSLSVLWQPDCRCWISASTTRMWRPSLNCLAHLFWDILNVFEAIYFAQPQQRKSFDDLFFFFPFPPDSVTRLSVVWLPEGAEGPKTPTLATV